MAISFIGTNEVFTGLVTSVAVTVPSTAVAGDLLIFSVKRSNNGAGTTATPTGWTAVGHARAGTSDAGSDVYYKIAVSGDAGKSYTVSWSTGSSYAHGAILVYRGVYTPSPIGAVTTEAKKGTSSTDGGIIRSVTTTKANSRVVRDINTGSSGMFDPPQTEDWIRRDSTTNSFNGRRSRIHDKFFASSGTSTGTWNDTIGTNSFSSVVYEIKANEPPTAPGTPTTTSPARGTQRISWAASSDPEGAAVTYDVELSMNNGSTWSRLASGKTTAYHDYNFSAQGQSTTAKLRVRSYDGITYSGWTTGATFTVNDLPSAPAVTAPNGGETWNASHTITWNAGADNDVAASTLKYQIQLSTDGGSTYPTTIVSLTAAGATSYAYDFTNVPSTTAARIRIRTYDGIEYSAWDASDANFTIQHNQAPNAPTLLSPANGGTIDLSGTIKYDWTFNDPDAGDSQSAFAFRRKISGAASYEYFNVATGVWQSTEVWNGSTSTEYTFAAGQWANGNTYNWSVATKDSQGVAGPYAGDWTITGGTPPVTTVDSPVGTATASQPMVEWTYFSPDGRAQLTYQVKVFDAAMYGASGFDPNTSTAAWDSTEVASATTRNRQVGVALDQGTYRAYVRTQDSSNIYSAWAYAQFSLTYNPPGVPSITVADDPENARIIIDVQGHDNLLTENQASLETDTTGWAAMNNATVARSTTQAYDGVASLAVTSAAAGNVQARTDPVGTVAVVAGQTYTAFMRVRADGATARNVHIMLRWGDASNTYISAATSTSVSVSNAEWTTHLVTAVAPEGAAYAYLGVTIEATAAAGELFYVDTAGIFPGDVTEWARGGIAYMTTFVVERSFDGGITWEPVRGTEDGAPHDGEPTQQLRVLDREMGPGATVTYRAYVKVEV